MDIGKLNEWVKSEEGQAWLNEHKKPLIDKKDELLGKLKTLNEGHSKTVQELNDATALLDQERAATRATLVKQAVDFFVSQRVAQGMEDGARALLSSVDVSVRADGLLRVPIVGKENLEGLSFEGDPPDSLPLQDYLEAWSQTEGAKAYIKAPGNTGGGAHGGFSRPRPTDAAAADDFAKAVLDKL
jgi:hypothetical protein